MSKELLKNESEKTEKIEKTVKPAKKGPASKISPEAKRARTAANKARRTAKHIAKHTKDVTQRLFERGAARQLRRRDLHHFPIENNVAIQLEDGFLRYDDNCCRF